MSKIVFECLGFRSTEVYYKMEDGYLYHFGYLTSHKGFESYNGFISRDRTIPKDLPKKEEVEKEYSLQFKLKGVCLNPSNIVYSG